MPGAISLDDFCARPHALFNGLATLIAGTDIVATVPDYAADVLTAAGGVRSEELPLESRTFELHMAWRGSQDNDPEPSRREISFPLIVTFVVFDSCNKTLGNRIRPSQITSADFPMIQSLTPLRYPLAALALVVLSACGKGPESAAQAPAAAKVNVAKVLEQPVNEWDEVT
nr:hypothetical protein [Tanacetum cinerariifolium]